jgi:sulfur relay (sulfurtransferase) complex TusBCD TusD component (DsrE family)
MIAITTNNLIYYFCQEPVHAGEFNVVICITANNNRGVTALCQEEKKVGKEHFGLFT